MHKAWKNILLLLAVFTVIAHSILPHVHLDDIVAIMDHQHHPANGRVDSHHHHDTGDHQEDHHNIFSFAQLDEDFIPAKVQFKKFELPVQYLSPVAITYLFDTFPVYTKQIFGRYEEYPPPGHCLHHLPARAPPALCLS